MGESGRAGKRLGMKHRLQFRALSFDIGQLRALNRHRVHPRAVLPIHVPLLAPCQVAFSLGKSHSADVLSGYSNWRTPVSILIHARTDCNVAMPHPSLASH